ncbi:MAG: hypothetical protein ACI9W6_001715 [Motiliproteus sp.]
MANSILFIRLVKAIESLNINLLPAFSPTADYNTQQIDMTRGYKLLVHAELESYFEEVTKKLINAQLDRWRNKKEFTLTSVSLVATYKIPLEEFESEMSSKKTSKLHGSIDQMIESSTTEFNRLVSNNNGIKVEDLKRLLIPTGIFFDELDDISLAAINDFGKERGAVAHSSINTTKHIPDPKTESTKVNGTILSFVEDLDSKLVDLEPSLADGAKYEVIISSHPHGFYVSSFLPVEKTQFIENLRSLHTDFTITSIGPNNNGGDTVHVIMKMYVPTRRVLAALY